MTTYIKCIRFYETDFSNLSSAFYYFAKSLISNHPVSGPSKPNFQNRKKPGFNHQCLLCERRFLKRMDLFQHTESAHPQDCVASTDKNDEKSSEITAKGTQNATDSKRRRNPRRTCEKAILESNDLSENQVKILTNKGSKKRKIEKMNKFFSCSLCPVEFSQESTLTRHVAVVHEGKKPYLCKICKTSFAQTQTLQRHINAKHTKEKKFFHCRYCNYPLSRQDKRTKHEKRCPKNLKQIDK